MSFYDAIRVGASGAGDFEIERSIRINPSDSARLSRTFPQAGNRKTFTFSAWVKRASFGSGHTIFACATDSSNIFAIYFPSGQFSIRSISGGSDQFEKNSTALFRDITAWYHIVVAIDMTQSTAEDRAKGYINGEKITDWATNTIPAQNTDLLLNSAQAHNIGRMGGIGNYWDGYIAEANFIDGQALTPASFAETNAITGQWIPKKYVGSYGTNGFRLEFADNSAATDTTLGKDTSGNGNNFSPSNLSVSAGQGNDSLEDTPTNNFCTLNPLAGYQTSFESSTNGNLDFSLSHGEFGFSTFEIPTSGKWYAEVVFTTHASGRCGITNLVQKNSSKWNGIDNVGGAIRVDDSTVQSGISNTIGDNKVVGIKVDRDAGTVAWEVDGSAAGSAVNISSMSDPNNLVFAVGRNSSSGSAPTGFVNFGQRPFSYLPTGYQSLCSANLSDPTILLPDKQFETLLYTGNGGTQSITGLEFQPDWVWLKKRNGSTNNLLYDAVRGATKELSSNLTAPEGNEPGSVSSFNSNGFSVGSNGGVNGNSDTFVAWNWNAGATDSATYTVKVVSDSGNKYRFNDYGTSAVTLDLAEGGTYTFDQSDSSMSSHPMQLSTTANGTHGGGAAYSTGVTYQLDGSTVTASAFISGFSSASSRKLIITVAASAPTLYYYCYYHSGMGGAVNTNSTSGSSNFAGSIQSTVKVNTTAGFSIATWTSDGSGSPTSFGHGLGVQPDFVLIKNRSGSNGNWQVWSPTFSNATNNFISFNLDTGTQTAGAAMWGTINSSIVSFRHSANSSNGNTMIGYFFNSVEGYSKFGKYTGNGNANGTFVFTGFRPAWVMIKTTQQDGDWIIIDNKRDIDNVTKGNLQANQNSSENTSYEYHDFLANGFKLRTSSASRNPSGQTMLFYAFAESPFKNSRAR